MDGPKDARVTIYPEQLVTHNKGPWSGNTKCLQVYFCS